MQLDLIVGLFVLAAFGILLWGTVQVGALPGLFGETGHVLMTRFDNVAGLDEETEVMIAGVPVGRVSAIALEGRSARVTMRIEHPDLEIPVDSVVAIRSRGLLGERVLEIEPGSSPEPIAPGGVITRTRSGADLDELLDRLATVAADIQEVSATMRNVLGGPEGEEAVREVVANLRALTSDLRGMIEDNESRVERIAKNFDAFSTDLREITANNREALGDMVANLREASTKLNGALDTLSRVAARVEQGDGTLGKLLSDDGLYEEVDAAVAEVRAALREVRRAAEETQEQVPSTILTTIFGSLF